MKIGWRNFALGFPACATIFDLDLAREKISELQNALSQEGVWDDPESATKLSKELDANQRLLADWRVVEERFQELELYLELAQEDNPDEMEAVDSTCSDLDQELSRLERRVLLSGEFDTSSAILSVHAGTGGLDAQDWADMLLRMYLRWAQKEGYKVELADVSPAEVGIHSATVFVQGEGAYGSLRSERGVHRLVRISPFDQAKRRHTSFAKVEVLPEIEGDLEVDIRAEDIKVDTYRSSGAGGQHVNKTDSAVRITHIPTGIVVSCQNERSQHANRLTAMRLLKARLFELQREQHEAKLSQLKGEHREAAWANQIRNYVLHPYTQVKDRRTGAETTDVKAVLDGDIDMFIRAYLEAYARLGREPQPGDV